MNHQPITAKCQLYKVQSLQGGNVRVTIDLQHNQDEQAAHLMVYGINKAYGELTFQPLAIESEVNERKRRTVSRNKA